MHTTQTVNKADYLSLLCLVGGCCGFLAAPYLHGVASLYEMLNTNYIVERLGFGGPNPTQAQLALNMDMTLMLHAALFGLFVLLMSNGKMHYKPILAIVATVSCSLWLLWIQAQPADPFPTINFSNYLFDDASKSAAMTWTSILSMTFISIVRSLQQTVHSQIARQAPATVANDVCAAALCDAI